MSAPVLDPQTATSWFHRMFRGELPRSPVAQLLNANFRHVDVQAGELEVDYEATPTFANPAGTVQGGMLGAMLDDLAAGVVDATLAPGEIVVTLNLNLSYQRAARVGVLQGSSRLMRRGREVCHVQAELVQAGQVVASAVGTCMIVRPKAEAKS